jgi:hypothetical protein
MAISAVIVATLSSHFGKVASPALLRKAFAGLLFSIALFTIAQTWIF